MPSPFFAQAAYNHVPLNDQVFFPNKEEVDAVSHDAPFEDGLSGTLRLKITQCSPLLVNGLADLNTNHIKARELPILNEDGMQEKSWGFEGSSLRGAVRQVLNIATFGKVSPTTEERFHLRDLGDKSYQRWMTEIVQPEAPPTYQTWVEAGRLRFDASKGEWLLEGCNYSRVQHFSKDYAAHRLGETRHRNDDQGWTLQERASCLMNVVPSPNRFDLNFYADAPFRPTSRNDKQPFAAKDFYEWLGTNGNAPGCPDDFAVTFKAGPITSHQHDGKQLIYSRATELRWRSPGGPIGHDGTIAGHLVFTGNIGATRGSHKHMEFVFHLPEAGTAPVKLPPELMRNFREINKESEDFKYWGDRYKRNQCEFIPVFWVGHPTQGADDPDAPPAAIGLCQMFKLPSAKTTRGFLSPGHNDPKPDWSDLIFGVANNRDSESKSHKNPAEQTGLAHRVQFSPVLCTTPDRVSENKIQYRVTLAQPKAFPAFAVKQEREGGAAFDYSAIERTKKLESRTDYVTLVDDEAEWSGRRRYPARKFSPPPAPGKVAKVVKVLQPIVAKSGFEPIEYGCNVNVHNLRPFEFGALLWALTFGHLEGPSPYVHQVGLAKAYAMGQIRIEIDWEQSAVRLNDEWNKRLSLVDAHAYVDRFAGEMEAFCGENLTETPSVKTLLYMAQPALGEQLVELGITKFAHPPLSSKENPITFKSIKAGKHVLPTYIELVEAMHALQSPAQGRAT